MNLGKFGEIWERILGISQILGNFPNFQKKVQSPDISLDLVSFSAFEDLRLQMTSTLETHGV